MIKSARHPDGGIRIEDFTKPGKAVCLVHAEWPRSHGMDCFLHLFLPKKPVLAIERASHTEQA